MACGVVGSGRLRFAEDVIEAGLEDSRVQGVQLTFWAKMWLVISEDSSSPSPETESGRGVDGGALIFVAADQGDVLGGRRVRRTLPS